MIIEVDSDSGSQWLKMIQNLEKNSKFIFMRPTTTTTGGARAFFINYKDPECTRKYLKQ